MQSADVCPYRNEVMVDRKAGIDPDVVASISTDSKVGGVATTCVVVPSNCFCEMQTYDFVTGAVKRRLEKNDKSYIDHMGLEPKMFRTKNRRSGRTSTRTVTHPDTVGKPPLRGCYAHPMVDDDCLCSKDYPHDLCIGCLGGIICRRSR